MAQIEIEDYCSYKQEMRNWCWAACVNMAQAISVGESDGQEEIVSTKLGVECGINRRRENNCNVHCSRIEISDLLQSRGFRVDRANVPCASSVFPDLRSGRLAAFARSDLVDYHMVLVVDVERAEEASRDVFIVVDPKGSVKAISRGSFLGTHGSTFDSTTCESWWMFGHEATDTSFDKNVTSIRALVRGARKALGDAIARDEAISSSVDRAIVSGDVKLIDLSPTETILGQFSVVFDEEFLVNGLTPYVLSSLGGGTEMGLSSEAAALRKRLSRADARETFQGLLYSPDFLATFYGYSLPGKETQLELLDAPVGIYQEDVLTMPFEERDLEERLERFRERF